ncbi:MAG TPA: hypothetical protein DEQ47_03945 [Solibacterales bacterium]|jgi:two-component system sensor histidine kinase CpxA|nr:hypothetical protein [Bryobacterales bacterium]
MNAWRSLFAKILLWFLATVTVTFMGAVYISSLNPPVRAVFFGHIATEQFHEARRTYESGGKDALRKFLDRLAEGTGMRAILADANGHDLVTGEDVSRHMRNRRTGPGRRPMPSFNPVQPFVRRPMELVRRSADGRYWWMILPLHPRGSDWPLHASQIWIIAAIVLLCWLLAYNLTTPLRGLQKTLERFGRGDFSARSGSRRHDELGQLARTFDVMAARIETLVASQRRLLLDISHELRSPLTRLGVAVEIARAQTDTEASLNRIQREADRLNSLVDQLLQVTRAESDTAGLRGCVQLDLLLRDIAADCDIEAAALGTSIEVTTEPVMVRGDEELLRRAAENILRNALRYSPPGHPVVATVGREGASAVLGIRDWGSGVPENQLQRIFDHFYRVDSDRNRLSGGVGLGLSIARRAVELHHGSIAARNAGPGLMVEIRLPAFSESESRSAA